MSALLHIDGLNAAWPGSSLLHIDALTLQAGDWHVVSGPSGQGKSTLLQCVLGLPPDGLTVDGRISGDLTATPVPMGAPAHARLIGPLAYLHQHPGEVFPGHRRVGAVAVEAVQHHMGLPHAEATARVRTWLSALQLPKATMARFPHQLSGGQLQRVQLAMLLAWEPRILLLDEPVASLEDATSRLVLDVLLAWLRQGGRAILHVTHRPERMEGRPHTPWVLQAGGLVTAPRELPTGRHQVTETTLSGGWRIEGLSATPTGRRGPPLLSGIDLRLPAATTVAITGPSGAGKTTLAHALAWLPRPLAGRFLQGSTPIRSERAWHDQVAFVPQDPTSAFAPHLTVGMQLDEVLRARRPHLRVEELVRRVDLSDDVLARRPGALSGGQLQRLTLVRALCSGARLWILDEPTSALDPTRKSLLADLLRQLQAEHGLTLVLLTHDLPFAARLAHRWLALRDGRLVEHTPVQHASA